MVRMASIRWSSDPVGSVKKTSSGCATPVGSRQPTGATRGLPGSQGDEKFTHFQTFQLPVTSSPR